jgi:hypothetical protein
MLDAACSKLRLVRFPSPRPICHLFTATRTEGLDRRSRVGRASYVILVSIYHCAIASHMIHQPLFINFMK